MAERRNFGVLITSIVCTFLAAMLLAGCQSESIPTAGKVRVAKDGIVPDPTAGLVAVTTQQLIIDQALTVTPVLSPRAIETHPATRRAQSATDTLIHSIATKPTTAVEPTLFPTLDGALPTPPLPIPKAVNPLEKDEDAIVIALLGNDVPWAQGGRTDSIILVSWQRVQGKVNIISLPRDLYVVIPGWRMERINLALPHGHGTNYPGGGGGLLKDTILYNLGIPVDYYLRIGFSGFKTIVDKLGGVEIVVNCPIEDWRLREPDLDPEVAQNWEPFLLKPGVHQMDGELALWYVRSRHNSNDLDRGRRQQKVIRALVQKGQSKQALLQLPQIWHGFAEMFETDLQLTDALELATLVPRIDSIDHLLFSQTQIRSWTVPHSGEAVQLLDYVAAEPVLRQFMGKSVLHDVQRTRIKVLVETHDPILYQQVADNLLWYGFEPSYRYRKSLDPDRTTIHLKGNNVKGTYAWKLATIFRQHQADIEMVGADESVPASYHIDLGQTYNPCLAYFEAARSTEQPEPDKQDALPAVQTEVYTRNHPPD